MARADLTGRVVAITGGARGIGRATASAFVDRGARVVIGDIDEDQVRQTAEEIGSATTGLPLDVTSEQSFAAFLETVRRDVGPVDVLVNNAGIMPTGPFVDRDLARARAVLEINLWGVMVGCHLVLPHMRDRRSGHVINVASVLGRVAGAGVAAYSGTKFGVIGFTEALRRELRGTGVRATVVLPSIVRTELSAGFNDSGPVIEPTDVAAAIVRACGSRASEVTVPRWAGPVWRALAAVPPRATAPLLRALDYDRAVHDVGAEAKR